MNDKYLMIDQAFPNPILEFEGLVQVIQLCAGAKLCIKLWTRV
jgi:hypothetical protein